MVMVGRCRVNVGSIWGQCGVDVGSIWGRCRVDVFVEGKYIE